MVEYNLAKTPIVDAVNQIILYAAQNNASDIHFDPRAESLMIRMRFDGLLRNHALIPKAYERNLITRIKLVAGMNITETRLPQDGAIKGRIGGRDLDMRVSALPTNEGEKIVIRILDFQKGLAGIQSLGFSKINEEKVKRMMSEPNGIILVTGATGTGKSTTTYSMLQALNKEETNIITVEDPVEMNIEGVNQIQVNSEIGMTFASALRSILRQDPNVILIGEIRDSETAQIAIRASITGHLVLSTIHTNNALATIERLLDMDVERYLLSTALSGIISQQLTRMLCDKCKKLRPVTKYERHLFLRVLGKKVRYVYEQVGCEHCHDGFNGRIALHEVLLLSDKLKELISDDDTPKDYIREAVYDGKTNTILQDALEKVVAGYTTFQEVYKVVDLDAELDNSIRLEIGADPLMGADDSFIINTKYEKLSENYDIDDEDLSVVPDYYINEDEGLEDGLDIFETDFNLETIKPNVDIIDDSNLILDAPGAVGLSTLAGLASEDPVKDKTLNLDDTALKYGLASKPDFPTSDEINFGIDTTPIIGVEDYITPTKMNRLERLRRLNKVPRKPELELIDASVPDNDLLYLKRKIKKLESSLGITLEELNKVINKEKKQKPTNDDNNLEELLTLPF